MRETCRAPTNSLDGRWLHLTTVNLVRPPLSFAFRRQWGSSPDAFPAWLREAYVDALRDPARVHAICEEYRAAAGIDREIDRADLDANRRIICPLLALWSDRGGLARWYEDAGGALGLWRRWADDVQGQSVSGGHFFPEEDPATTARLIRAFLESEGYRQKRTERDADPRPG